MENGEKKHAEGFIFLKVVYIFHARHQTPQMPASKMRGKDAADLQKGWICFRTMWMDVQ
jgi:hypothetical protein